MAIQTLFQHYFSETMRRAKYQYDGGHVTVSVPRLPGLEADGNSEYDAAVNYLGVFVVWLLKQLEQGLPVPPLGDHDLNTDHNRRLFTRETGIDIPLLKEQPDPDQMWFWTPQWQAMERESDEDIAAGRVHRFTGEEDFEAALEAHQHPNADVRHA